MKCKINAHNFCTKIDCLHWETFHTIYCLIGIHDKTRIKTLFWRVRLFVLERKLHCVSSSEYLMVSPNDNKYCQCVSNNLYTKSFLRMTFECFQIDVSITVHWPISDFSTNHCFFYKLKMVLFLILTFSFFLVLCKQK